MALTVKSGGGGAHTELRLEGVAQESAVSVDVIPLCGVVASVVDDALQIAGTETMTASDPAGICVLSNDTTGSICIRDSEVEVISPSVTVTVGTTLNVVGDTTAVGGISASGWIGGRPVDNTGGNGYWSRNAYEAQHHSITYDTGTNNLPIYLLGTLQYVLTQDSDLYAHAGVLNQAIATGLWWMDINIYVRQGNGGGWVTTVDPAIKMQPGDPFPSRTTGLVDMVVLRCFSGSPNVLGEINRVSGIDYAGIVP